MVGGADRIKIHGQYLPVRAAVKNLDMLSAHADADEVMTWLQGFKRAPRTLGDFQPINEQIFEERREHSWQQVLDDAEHTYAALTEHVRAIDAQALLDPQRFAWNNGQTLAASILGNGFWHPIEHVARFYDARGEPDRASELLEQTIVREPALEAFPSDRGAALYNLACFYATTGHPDKALPLLPDALRLRPDLVEWSKEDSDLDALRDVPAFKALYDA